MTTPNPNPNPTQSQNTTKPSTAGSTINANASPKAGNLFVDTKLRPNEPIYNPYTASTSFTQQPQAVHYVGQYGHAPTNMYQSAFIGQSYAAPAYTTSYATGYAEAPARLTGLAQATTHTGYQERVLQAPTYSERLVQVPGYQQRQVQVPTVAQTNVQVPTQYYVDKVTLSPGRVHTIQERLPDKEYTYEHRTDTHWNERNLAVPTYQERDVVVPGYQQRQVQVPSVVQKNVQVPTYKYVDQVNVSPGKVHTIQEKLPDKEYTYEHRTDTHWNERNLTVPTYQERDVVVPGYQEKQVQVPTVVPKNVQVPTYKYVDKVNVSPGRVHTIQEKLPDKEYTYEHRTDTHWNERNVTVPTYQEREVVVPGYQEKQVQVPTVQERQVQVPTYKYVDKVNVSPGRVHTIQEKLPDKEYTYEHRTDTHWNERNVTVPTYQEREVVVPGYQEKQVQVPTVKERQVQVPTYKYVDKVNVSPGRVHTIQEKLPDKEYTYEHRTDTLWSEKNVTVPTYQEREVVVPGYQEKQVQVPTVKERQVQVPTYKYVDKVNVSPGRVHTIREKLPDKEYTYEHRLDTHWNEREVKVPTYTEREIQVPGYVQKTIQVPTFKEKQIQVPTYKYVDKVTVSPGRVHTIKEKLPDKEYTYEHRVDTHWNEKNVTVPTYQEREVVVPGYQEKQVQVPTVKERQVQVPTYKYVDKVNVSPGRVHTIQEKLPDKEYTYEHRVDTHWNEKNVTVPTYQEREVVVPGYQQKQVQVPTVVPKNVQVPTYKYVDKVNVSPGRVHTIQEKLPDKEYTYEHRTDTHWNERNVNVPTYHERDVVVPGYQQKQVQVPTVVPKNIQVPTYQYYDQVNVSPGRVHTIQEVQPPRERVVQTPGYKATDYVTYYTPQTYATQTNYTSGAGQVVYEGPAQGYQSVGVQPYGFQSVGVQPQGFQSVGVQPQGYAATVDDSNLSPSKRFNRRRDILDERNKVKK